MGRRKVSRCGEPGCPGAYLCKKCRAVAMRTFRAMGASTGYRRLVDEVARENADLRKEASALEAGND